MAFGGIQDSSCCSLFLHVLTEHGGGFWSVDSRAGKSVRVTDTAVLHSFLQEEIAVDHKRTKACDLGTALGIGPWDSVDAES